MNGRDGGPQPPVKPAQRSQITIRSSLLPPKRRQARRLRFTLCARAREFTSTDLFRLRGSSSQGVRFLDNDDDAEQGNKFTICTTIQPRSQSLVGLIPAANLDLNSFHSYHRPPSPHTHSLYSTTTQLPPTHHARHLHPFPPHNLPPPKYRNHRRRPRRSLSRHLPQTTRTSMYDL